MLNSHANGSSMKKPISAMTAMIAQSIQRCDAFVSHVSDAPRRVTP